MVMHYTNPPLDIGDIVEVQKLNHDTQVDQIAEVKNIFHTEEQALLSTGETLDLLEGQYEWIGRSFSITYRTPLNAPIIGKFKIYGKHNWHIDSLVNTTTPQEIDDFMTYLQEQSILTILTEYVWDRSGTLFHIVRDYKIRFIHILNVLEESDEHGNIISFEVWLNLLTTTYDNKEEENKNV